MLTMLSVKEQDLGEQSVCVFIEAPSSLDIWIMAEKTHRALQLTRYGNLLQVKLEKYVQF